MNPPMFSDEQSESFEVRTPEVDRNNSYVDNCEVVVESANSTSSLAADNAETADGLSTQSSTIVGEEGRAELCDLAVNSPGEEGRAELCDLAANSPSNSNSSEVSNNPEKSNSPSTDIT